MTDITTVWRADLASGDWQMSGADLLSGNDLATAVLISLFTDRLANTDDAIPDGTNDPRGWWGDISGASAIGSRLWLLARSKLLPSVALKAKGFCVEALQWLIDDSVAQVIDVATQILHPNRLNIVVTITKGNKPTIFRFMWVWDQVFGGPQTIIPSRGAIVTETGDALVTEDGTILTI